MIRWIDTRRIQPWQIALLVFILFSSVFFSPSQGIQSNSFEDSLILNVYLDPSGKALVTGYADNITGLDFLPISEYQFENDTNQLFALTNGLTTKNSDIWTLGIDAQGLYENYRITFYLPGDMRLRQINASSGLEYHLLASNDSLVADVQGYEVRDPSISIQYQQSLAAVSTSFPPPAVPSGYPGTDINLIILLIGAFLIAMGSALAVAFWRQRIHPFQSAPLMEGDNSEDPDAGSFSPLTSPDDESKDEGWVCKSQPSSRVESRAGLFLTIPADAIADAPVCRPEDGGAPSPSNEASNPPTPKEGTLGEKKDEKGKNETGRIELSREMKAVIQTLTSREQAVIMTLIDHGGRMTQAEIRYETRTPKSSLTGILISLVRKKLVTKKEWGRTNMIELSEWFLSQRERS